MPILRTKLGFANEALSAVWSILLPVTSLVLRCRQGSGDAKYLPASLVTQENKRYLSAAMPSFLSFMRFSVDVCLGCSAIIDIHATGAVDADDQSCVPILPLRHRHRTHGHQMRRVAMKTRRLVTATGSMVMRANLLYPLRPFPRLGLPKKGRSRRHLLKSSDTTGRAYPTPWLSCER